MTEPQQVDDAVSDATDRVDYRLTFAATPETRGFGIGMLDGPNIPDAYAPAEMSSSEWCHDMPRGWYDADASASQDDVLAHYLEMAVCEGVHEVLEWFKVDGKQWLDPHGKHEQIINELVTELGEKLGKVARGQDL